MEDAKRLGALEEAVLMAVTRLRDRAYGVPIRHDVVERTGKTIAVGAIYTTLARLEEKGFISSWVGEATPERGGRAKKYYAVKAPGVRALQESQRITAYVWGNQPVPSGA